MDVIEALNWRYAVKQFSQTKLQQSQVDTLVEAVRLSPSSYGLQPYNIIVVESDDKKRELLTHSFGQDKVMHCSHLVVFATQTNIDEQMIDGYIMRHAQTQQITIDNLAAYARQIKSAILSMNEQQKQAWAQQQTFIALGIMLASAALLKIDACPMGGFDGEAYNQVLGLEKLELTSTVICPIGYRHADDKYAQKPKVRFGLTELKLAV